MGYPYFGCVLLAMVLILSNSMSAGACRSETLTSLNGTVACPSGQDPESRYAPKLDSRWLIPTAGVKVIRFVKVDVESRLDNILIFEGTESVEPDRMRFRINSADAVMSEFWLAGKTLVRFHTDEHIERTGFKFFYETKTDISVPAATEVIRQRSGYRFSHPGFGQNSYPNGLKLAWSIFVPNGSLLTVTLSAFNTQADRDFLRIYFGIVPNVSSTVLYEFSGNRTISEMTFTESVTLIFTTGGHSSAVNGGFVFSFMVLEASACWQKVNLTANEGIISSSAFDSEASSQVNNDICWLVNASGFIGINFYRLDIDSCCDEVCVYANSDVPNKEKEVLRLSKSDEIMPEFWLGVSETVLIRFRASRKSRIEFAYRTNSEQDKMAIHLSNIGIYQGANLVVIEQIKSEGGSRSSVSGHRSFGVSSAPESFAAAEQLRPVQALSSGRVVYMWVINSKITEAVTVSFSNLSAKFQHGKLEVFSGPHQTVAKRTGWNVFDGSATEVERPFLGGATIMYSSTTVAYHSGFDFEFNVGRRIYPVFQQWSGKFSGNSSMNLLVQSSAAGASAQCQARSSCGNRTFTANLTHSNHQYLRALYLMNHSNLRSHDFCIRDTRCTFRWPSGLPKILEKNIQLEEPNPESIIIKLMEPQLGSVTGVVQFLAVSSSVCPSVKHRCELSTADGEIFAAQLVKKDISEPAEPQCLTSVTSQFTVVAQPSIIAGSAIKCRLLNGDSVLLELQQPNADGRLARVWEMPLLLASSTIAILAIIALSSVICTLIIQKRRQSKAEKSQFLDRPSAKPNQYTTRKHPASEIYLN